MSKNLVIQMLQSMENSTFVMLSNLEKFMLYHTTLFSLKLFSPLVLIHTDIWGPAPIVSNLGYKYYIYFRDDFSKYTWAYPLRSRVEALSSFILFKNQVEKTLDTKIKKLQSDWGGEYRPFENCLKDNG